MNFDTFSTTLEREGVEVFSLRDAARVIGKPLPYARVFLSRLAKRGKLEHIERGKYCLPSAGELETASNLIYPSYISFLSALAFHKLTTQIPLEAQVACPVQKKALKYGNMKIRFVQLKKRAFFGFRRFGGVFCAEPEKALIDGLYLPECLPLSEALYALKQKSMDVGKLCEYAGRMGSPIVKRRLGFLLEKAGFANPPIKTGKSTRYFPLNPFLKAEGRKDKRWQLLINEELE